MLYKMQTKKEVERSPKEARRFHSGDANKNEQTGAAGWSRPPASRPDFSKLKPPKSQR